MSKFKTFENDGGLILQSQLRIVLIAVSIRIHTTHLALASRSPKKCSYFHHPSTIHFANCKKKNVFFLFPKRCTHIKWNRALIQWHWWGWCWWFWWWKDQFIKHSIYNSFPTICIQTETFCYSRYVFVIVIPSLESILVAPTTNIQETFMFASVLRHFKKIELKIH